MLLCIDVGNTETKLGAFDAAGALVGTWRVTTARRRTADEYGVLFAAFFSTSQFPIDGVEAIVVSSVVPVVDRPLAEGCEKYFAVRPREVGSDLVAAAIGAVQFVGAPAIAVNFGTATTFGAIDRDGAYVGVAIATGLQVALDALVGRTANLPRVARVAPESAIGRDTVASIQSGLIFGTVGQTEELVRRIRAEIGTDARVIASGGLASVVAAETRVIERVEPHLVLHRLRAHYLRSSQG